MSASGEATPNEPASAGSGGIGRLRRPDVINGSSRPDVEATLLDTIAAIEFDAETIAAAVRRLAVELARDLAHEPFILIGVLKGALFFTADLARALPTNVDVTIDFIAVSSYGRADRSSGEVRLLKDTSESVEGKNVVIVEDIVDNGLTLQYLQRLIGGRNPASLRTCALLDKPYRRRVDVPVDYIGLTAPDTFVVGYGLDYQEKYRNLPYLARLHDWAFAGEGRE